MIEEIYPRSRSRLMSRLMKTFFDLLYHPLAWSYDLVAAFVSLGRWKSWVQAAASQVSGNRILELGFGPGHLQMSLLAQGKQAFGLDESMTMGRQAKFRIRRSKHVPRVLRGLAQQLPYAGSSFDSVVATFPTQYIVHPLTLAEIQRVLRPGGKLVVLFAAWHTGRSLPERLMALLFKTTGQVPSVGEGEEKSFTQPFTQAGFDAQVIWADMPGSRLVFVVSRKPKSDIPT